MEKSRKKSTLYNTPIKFDSYLNPTNIYQANRPLLFISFLMGILPFRLNINNTLQVTWYGFINTFLHILIFSSCFVITISTRDSFINYFFTTSISLFGDALLLVISFIAITIIFTTSIWKRYALINSLKELYNIDEQLQQLGVDINYKCTLHFILFSLILKYIVYTIYFSGSFMLLRNYNIRPNFTAWISYFLPHFMISMVSIQFFCIVKQITQRLSLINNVCILLLYLYDIL